MTTPTNVYSRNIGPLQRTQGSISGTYTAATDVSTTTNAAMAAGVLTLTLGFVPKHFLMQNVTQKWKFEWYEGMAADTYIVTQADGDATLSDDAGISIDLRTGLGGLAGTRAAGTADTTPLGVVTITAAATATLAAINAAVAYLFTDNDTVTWVAEG